MPTRRRAATARRGCRSTRSPRPRSAARAAPATSTTPTTTSSCTARRRPSAAGIELEAGQHLIRRVRRAVDPGQPQRQRRRRPSLVPAARRAPGHQRRRRQRRRRSPMPMPVEVSGFALGVDSANAIDVTTAAALTGSATLTIANNVIHSAGAEGIDVNLNAGTTGTLALAIMQATAGTPATRTPATPWTSTASAGTLNLTFSSNTNIDRTARRRADQRRRRGQHEHHRLRQQHGSPATRSAPACTISNVTLRRRSRRGGVQQVDGDVLTIGAAAIPSAAPASRSPRSRATCSSTTSTSSRATPV